MEVVAVNGRGIRMIRMCIIYQWVQTIVNCSMGLCGTSYLLAFFIQIKLTCNSTVDNSPWRHLAAFESWLVDPCLIQPWAKVQTYSFESIGDHNQSACCGFLQSRRINTSVTVMNPSQTLLKTMAHALSSINLIDWSCKWWTMQDL